MVCSPANFSVRKNRFSHISKSFTRRRDSILNLSIRCKWALAEDAHTTSVVFKLLKWDPFLIFCNGLATMPHMKHTAPLKINVFIMYCKPNQTSLQSQHRQIFFLPLQMGRASPFLDVSGAAAWADTSSFSRLLFPEPPLALARSFRAQTPMITSGSARLTLVHNLLSAGIGMGEKCHRTWWSSHRKAAVGTAGSYTPQEDSGVIWCHTK